MSDMTKKSPGWYPNPDSPDNERWWNGSSWSDNIRGEGSAGPATPVVVTADEPPQGKGVVAGCLVPALVLLVVVGVIVGFVMAMSEVWSPKERISSPTTPASDRIVVTYELSGTAANATVMFSTPTGHQQHDVTLPALDADGNTLLTFDFPRGGYVSISAQNSGKTGTITCTITADGEVISLNTSSSAFGVVRCDATLPFDPPHAIQ